MKNIFSWDSCKVGSNSIIYYNISFLKDFGNFEKGTVFDHAEIDLDFSEIEFWISDSNKVDTVKFELKIDLEFISADFYRNNYSEED